MLVCDPIFSYGSQDPLLRTPSPNMALVSKGLNDDTQQIVYASVDQILIADFSYNIMYSGRGDGSRSQHTQPYKHRL